jgi:hypothetical protein
VAPNIARRDICGQRRPTCPGGGGGVSRRSGRGNPARNTAECHRLAVSPGGRTERHVLTLARPEKRVRQQKFNPTGFAPTNLTGPDEMTIGGSSAASSICFSAAPRSRVVRPSMLPTDHLQSLQSLVQTWAVGPRLRSLGQLRQAQRDFVDRVQPRSRPIALPAAEKGGARTGDRSVARRTHHENPRVERS